MNTLLVVCIGNVCRSPMAQGLLAAQLQGWRVQSAGLNALVGAPADEIAVDLLRERGLDISGHRAMQITRRMCVESDMVFVMSREQRRELESLYPEICGRVFRLGEHADRDIPDPYRQPEPVFRHALKLIDEGVTSWVQRIRRL
ncbi:MAG TPA: low molecular weight protein-tyrosine-phosphatase [Ramlibacter sp.]|uniref:low molecular weight protein-tyrosine-phosphatase n=1 Tax=Ramlibacter sp. TaxID=1917967 RepID=UPI002D7EBF97|nr:low molecular weight protein-tyrosine-phosphatase [Ramlibacter sp.]HET8748401.1 low molecular weight protein-tyrosine-phosphatase [Ramlibacter sp.]